MRRLLPIAAILLLAAGAAANDPVKITGDKFVVDDANHVATFTGQVVVLRTKLTVWAAKVVVDYGNGGPNDIKSFIATGRVRIKTPEQEATGDQAVYNPNTQMLHLTGNVMVVNSTGTVGSSELVVNLVTNSSTFTSAKGGRVTGVFSPK